MNEILEREDIGISPIERQRFVEEMLEDSLGYGPLEALLADGSITEIMCNAFDEIWIERKGRIERTGGSVNLVAVALRRLRVLPPAHPAGHPSGQAAIRSRDFR